MCPLSATAVQHLLDVRPELRLDGHLAQRQRARGSIGVLLARRRDRRLHRPGWDIAQTPSWRLLRDAARRSTSACRRVAAEDPQHAGRTYGSTTRPVTTMKMRSARCWTPSSSAFRGTHAQRHVTPRCRCRSPILSGRMVCVRARHHRRARTPTTGSGASRDSARPPLRSASEPSPKTSLMWTCTRTQRVTAMEHRRRADTGARQH